MLYIINYLNGWVFTELVGTGETSRASADDDDVGIGVGDHIGHVPPCHLTRNDGLLDGLKFEGFEIVGR